MSDRWKKKKTTIQIIIQYRVAFYGVKMSKEKLNKYNKTGPFLTQTKHSNQMLIVQEKSITASINKRWQQFADFIGVFFCSADQSNTEWYVLSRIANQRQNKNVNITNRPIKKCYKLKLTKNDKDNNKKKNNIKHEIYTNIWNIQQQQQQTKWKYIT